MTLAIPRSMGTSFIESFMVDEVVITRDALGIEDAVLDMGTLELVDSGATDATIYDGLCIVKEVNTKDIQFERGEKYLTRDMYKMMIPVSATGIQVGDRAVLGACAYDPDLVGMELRVFQTQKSSHRVYRAMLVERVEEDKGAISR